MKRVTRSVRPEELRELLERPPRATLAFVRDGAIQVEPVVFRYDEGRHFIGLSAAINPPAAVVKLLVDDGRWYFDLRGVWIRGRLRPASISDPADDVAWFELQPEKSVAWHYGRMRKDEA